MSLQGTLETIPLPDVLALLAATKKTGELRITGARGDGRLWLAAGQVVGADVPRAATPVDAVFELLRLTAGSFTFGDGAPPAGTGEPLTVDGLLAEAKDRLGIWQAIEAVVPSMACTLRLKPELDPENVTVSRRQWKELVAVATGGDVSGAMKNLGIGEFDACRTVKGLVDAGLVQVGRAPAAPAPEASVPAAAAPPEAGPVAHGEPKTTEPKATKAAAPVRPAAPSPAPTARPVPGPARPAAPTARPAPVAGRGTPAPANAAPVAAANSGRGAARQAPEAAPSKEEADELVQHLATLGKAHVKTAPARFESGAAGGGDRDDDAPATPPKGEQEGDGSAEANGDEPINRGMLLKFLSSVRP